MERFDGAQVHAAPVDGELDPITFVQA